MKARKSSYQRARILVPPIGRYPHMQVVTVPVNITHYGNQVPKELATYGQALWPQIGRARPAVRALAISAGVTVQHAGESCGFQRLSVVLCRRKVARTSLCHTDLAICAGY